MAALHALKSSEDPDGMLVRLLVGCMKWHRRQMRQWKILSGGWRSAVFFPVRLMASVIAWPVQLARWKDLHAEDDYAEPPRSSWRIVQLGLQAPSPWTPA